MLLLWNMVPKLPLQAIKFNFLVEMVQIKVFIEVGSDINIQYRS